MADKRWERVRNTTGIVGESEEIARVLERIEQFARTDESVLLVGETGTGKELAARGLHRLSPRGTRRYVPVNLASLSVSVAESELFGHVKGAFTGADRQREGRFRYAHQGTLFLDEVTEADIAVQSKLLRVIETGEVVPVGSDQPIVVDVRLVTATNRDIRQAISDGALREDLLHRAGVLRIHFPPLRERREDIPLLVGHFFDSDLASARPRITRPAMVRLCDHDWPGNVRELRGVVARLRALYATTEVGPEDIDSVIHASHSTDGRERARTATVSDTWRVRENSEETDDWRLVLFRHFARVVAEEGGNVTRAAKRLNAALTTVRRRLRFGEAQGWSVDGGA